MPIIYGLALSGTTSAYAENTARGLTSPPWKRNYLRVRGEYIEDLDKARDMLELPPRTRRIRRQSDWTADLIGTTSAYAENTHRIS